MTAFLEFDAANHRYYADGELVPVSVTQILRANGLIQTEFMTEEHRERGTRVHAATRTWDETGKLDWRKWPEGEHGYIKAYQKARKEIGFTVKAREKMVYSAQYGYAGMLDLLWALGDVDGLVDLKTSAACVVPPYTRYQLTLYSMAYDPEGCPSRYGLALGSDGNYSVEHYPASDFVMDVSDSLALLRVFHLKRRIGQ